MTLAGVVAYIIGILNQLVGVLAVMATVLFMWGAFQYVYHTRGGKEALDRRRYMLWGLLALFILFSIWAILRVMCATFLGGSECSAPYSGGPYNDYQIADPRTGQIVPGI